MPVQPLSRSDPEAATSKSSSLGPPDGFMGHVLYAHGMVVEVDDVVVGPTVVVEECSISVVLVDVVVDEARHAWTPVRLQRASTARLHAASRSPNTVQVRPHSAIAPSQARTQSFRREALAVDAMSSNSAARHRTAAAVGRVGADARIVSALRAAGFVRWLGPLTGGARTTARNPCYESADT